MAAAATTTQGGASVILIDSAQTLGGHFYKSLPNGFNGTNPTRDRKYIQELHARAENIKSSQAEVFRQANVWGIFQKSETTTRDDATADEPREKHNFKIYAEHPAYNSVSIAAQALIIAPGIYDRPLPFPGWELPGVITPGALQLMLKKQGLLPGKRILVCGTGPLQMVVAAALVEEGADVVALLDTSGIFDGMRYMPGAIGSLKSRFGEAFHSIKVLVKNRVPILFRHAAFRAVGNAVSGVVGVEIGRVTPDGHPIPGTEQTLDVDTICCAYGFIPSIALTLHLGCEHYYDSNLCANIPQHDKHMHTSIPGVFVAGDITGAGGKPLADLQGILAGISALEQLGILQAREANKRRNQLAAAVRREQRFSRWLWNRYRIRGGLLDLASDDTLVCRCENITVGDIKQSLDHGGRDLYGVKLRTRTGMGSCQGRYCMINTALLIAQHIGVPVDETGIHSVRPPLSPVRLKNIADIGIEFDEGK
jgi:thioredoxin reductase